MNIGTSWQLATKLAESAEFDPDIVSPGFVGFALTGLLAVAVILLGVNLVRRLRRNAYRHDIRDEIAQELDERGTSDGQAGPDEQPRA